jgi:3-ketosteroid 9alpha-monooxygenase subunit B
VSRPGVTTAACSLLVVDVVQETPDARSLVLRVPDDQRERFRYRPGQFLTVRIPGPDGTATARCYSLSSAPGIDADLKVTVKRIADGLGSSWLCEAVRPGDRLDVLPPAGTFTPDLSADLLLLAAGSGITPMMSIVKGVLDRPGGSVVLVYANRDEHSVIFAAELRELEARHPDRLLVLHLLESLQGLPTVTRLARLTAPFAGRGGAYVCGPGPFMDAAVEAMGRVGLARDRIVLERYRSLTGDPFAEVEPVVVGQPGDEPATKVDVELDGERHTLDWPAGTTLLDLLLANGVRAPYSCREGACSACACRLVSGEVRMIRNEVLEDEDLAEGWVLACQSLPVSDEIRVSYD